MSKLYGTLRGAAKTTATRRGHSYIETHAASWNGAIRVTITIDPDGVETYLVEQVRWHGRGVNETLASGIVGEPTRADAA